MKSSICAFSGLNIIDSNIFKKPLLIISVMD